MNLTLYLLYPTKRTFGLLKFEVAVFNWGMQNANQCVYVIQKYP